MSEGTTTFIQDQVRRTDSLHDFHLAIAEAGREERKALLALAEHKAAALDQPVLFDAIKYNELIETAFAAGKKYVDACEALRKELVKMINLIDEHEEAITPTKQAPPKHDPVRQAISHIIDPYYSTIAATA